MGHGHYSLSPQFCLFILLIIVIFAAKKKNVVAMTRHPKVAKNVVAMTRYDFRVLKWLNGGLGYGYYAWSRKLCTAKQHHVLCQ